MPFYLSFYASKGEESKENGNRAFWRGKWTVAAGKSTAALVDVGRSPVDGGGGIIHTILLSNRAAAYAKMGTGKLLAALDDLAGRPAQRRLHGFILVLSNLWQLTYHLA